MAYTAANLTAVETAISDLVTGKKRMVEFSMPDSRVERYTDAKLPELRELRREIKEELSLTNNSRASRVFLSRHSKGL